MNDSGGTDPFEELVGEFLSKPRIAIWGIEDTKWDQGKMVASKFRERGVTVIAVSPTLDDNPDLEWSSSLTRIDPPVEAVLIFVDPEQAMAAVEDCIKAKVPLVWLHDALSAGAATPQAIDRLRSAGCTVIPGLCPMFFLTPLDPAHFCLKWFLRFNGKEERTRSHLEA